MSTPTQTAKPAVKVFVATTVMLTFISFWRAAAIVLSDLASSAYYAGGDAEKVIGKSAPWFILAVMLFSYAVRALYIESSSMFVRGGVYRVVKEAMGGTLAKFSVSALLFDYVLTGPISAVSAGQYLAGFIEDIGRYTHHPMVFSEDHFAAVFALIIVMLLLVEEHSGHSRIEREGLADHGDHHRDGGDPDHLVHHHGLPRAHPDSTQPASSRRHPDQPGVHGMARWDLVQPPDLDHRLRRLRPFGAGHERRGDLGPGQSRNRTSQVEEPGEDWAGHLHL